MDIHWLGTLQSVALLGSVVAAWTCIRNLAPWPLAGLRGIAFAVAMGLGTIVMMSMPVELAPGVRFDFRTSLLAAAALIGGPITIIAGVMAAVYRVYLGGAGMQGGIAGIAAATLVGLAFHWKTRARDPSLGAILLLSIATSFSGLLITPLLPTSVFAHMPGGHFATLSVLKIIGTAFCAIVLRQDSITSRIARENLVYRRIFEALPDSLNVKDADGRFIIANPATATLMHARNADALTGKTDFDFYPTTVAEQFREQELAIIAARENVTLDQTAVTADGGERQLITLKSPMFDSNGAFMGLITHNRDTTETNALKRDLASARLKLQDAIDTMTDGLAMYDMAGHLVYFNERCRDLFPLSGHLLAPGTHISELMAASAASKEGIWEDFDFARWLSGIDTVRDTPHEVMFQRFDGRWLSSRISVVGEGVLFMISDITETRSAQADLEKQMRDYQALFENSVAGIYRSTVDGRMLKANAALVRLNGFTRESDLLEDVRDIATEWYVNPTRRDDFKRIMQSEGRVTDFVSEVYRYKSRDRIWVSETAWTVASTDGSPSYFEGTVIEITDRKHAEEEMRKTNLKLLSLAATDGLTGLMNRRSFDESLERDLADASARGQPLSLVLIDVDHFKAYNDRYGHQAGDDCLRFLGQVLKSACRTPSDVACRYGGEEMAIILPNTSASDALAVAHRLSGGVRGLNLRHEASRKGIVTISAGVATAAPGMRQTPATLIRRADEALYAAKAHGRDCVEAAVPVKARPTGSDAGGVI